MGKFKTKLAAYFRGEKFTGSTISLILIGVIIAVNVIVYALTARFGLYLYKPEATDLTISGATDPLFEEAISKKEKITVMFCRAKDEMVLDEIGYFHETAKQFAERYDSLIDLEYVNIITKRNSKNELVDLSKYQLKGADGNPVPLYESSVVFIGEDQHKLVPDITSACFTYDSSNSSYQSYNGEEVFASMITWVLTDTHKTAYFTTYHGESVDLGFANMLACSGFNIETIDLRKNEIPEDAGLVVISNPLKDFERATEGSHIRSEIERLETYMEKGGNVYVAIDPYVEKLHILENFIAGYGISLRETERDGNVYKNIVKDSTNAITADSFTIVSEMADTDIAKSISENVAKYNSNKVIIRQVAALDLTGNAQAILVTSGNSSLYAGAKEIGTEGGYCIGAVASKTNDEGKTGNIFVMPSIYLTSNDTVVTTGYANRDFIYSTLEYVFGVENVPYGCNMVYTDTGILENLTMGTARTITALLMVIPVAIASVGAVIVIRRKNR